MKTNIALIGFMGTGKTVVGEALAEKLKRQFIELDALLEKRVGKSIREIFREDGEAVFRDMEIAVVREAAGGRNQVIACGGGVALNDINLFNLQQSSIIVLLTASPAVILKRTAGSEGRPLLDNADKISQIKELLKVRRPYYERAADITVNTSNLSIEGVVKEIIRKLDELG